MEKKAFGVLPGGEQATLYTITCGKLQAQITDFGATLVRLYVPDSKGNLSDVVLGFDDANGYLNSTTYFGATVGRNANRVGGATFIMNGQKVNLPPNDNGCNNLHSGPDSYAFRLWQVERYEEDAITFSLRSPDGDQGFPGNAHVRVTYALTADTLSITYDAVSDKDTVFNLTNHSYFNLAGHEKPELSLHQTLCMPARFYTPDDALSIPTGEKRSVEGTPFDFRAPKALGRDINEDYECLKLQGGYDHNFEVFCNPCAILHDPQSGRTMAVSTDCPGIQMYAGNFLQGDKGKDGVSYCYRGGVALETQFYPNAVNHPEWPQPFVKAGQRYHSETKYTFK